MKNIKEELKKTKNRMSESDTQRSCCLFVCEMKIMSFPKLCVGHINMEKGKVNN